MRQILHIVTSLGVIGLLWQAIVTFFDPPSYILPSPMSAVVACWNHRDVLLGHAVVTATEIAVGGTIAIVLGFGLGLVLAMRRGFRHWVMPLLAASQALPVFAIAPMLVLWLDYGLASKVAMTVLILFFPIVTAFYDGLVRISPGRIALASLIVEGSSYPRYRLIRHIIIPSAMPALASGLRITAALAPVGAIVGEWVGSGAGLGYFILHASARNQIDQLFAALIVLIAGALSLYLITDAVMRRVCDWTPD